MGASLDRNKPADWTKDPVVPVPGEPVKAQAQPGAVDPAFQALYSLIWSKLRGQVTYGALQIEMGGGDGSAPFPALTATEGLRVVLRRELLSPRIFLSYDSASGLRVYGETLLSGFDQTGALFVRTYASQARVVVDERSVQFQQQPAAALNTAVRNALIQELCPRAWGVIYTDGNGGFAANYPDGIGYTAAIVVDPNDGNNFIVVVTLAQAMASTRFHVKIQPLFNGAFVDATSIMAVREVLSQRTTTRIAFKAYVSNAAGAAAINCASTALGFSFDVFGRQP